MMKVLKLILIPLAVLALTSSVAWSQGCKGISNAGCKIQDKIDAFGAFADLIEADKNAMYVLMDVKESLCKKLTDRACDMSAACCEITVNEIEATQAQLDSQMELYEQLALVEQNKEIATGLLVLAHEVLEPIDLAYDRVKLYLECRPVCSMKRLDTIPLHSKVDMVGEIETFSFERIKETKVRIVELETVYEKLKEPIPVCLCPDGSPIVCHEGDIMIDCKCYLPECYDPEVCPSRLVCRIPIPLCNLADQPLCAPPAVAVCIDGVWFCN